MFTEYGPGNFHVKGIVLHQENPPSRQGRAVHVIVPDAVSHTSCPFLFLSLDSEIQGNCKTASLSLPALNMYVPLHGGHYALGNGHAQAGSLLLLHHRHAGPGKWFKHLLHIFL